ncbi:MAG: hypothetical protein QXJ94_04120 [Candidatus Bathyarchaeia archaeon]
MAKKSDASQKKKKIMSTKRLAFVSISIALMIVFTVFTLSYFYSENSDIFSLNAVIIDQLAKDHPNPNFVGNVTKLLKNHGFNVSYYCNETLDVDFFRTIAERRFGIIILRVHSALREDGSTVDLFTSEKWIGQYTKERDKGLIVYGRLINDPNLYCAITYNFIGNLSGRFPKSIIFAMGCWSLKANCEQLAQAFINKGAKAYIGWTEEVLPSDTDNETFKLMKMLLDDGYPLGYAVRQTKAYNYTGVSPNGEKILITTQLRFYPNSTEVNNLKMSELTEEAEKTYTSSLKCNLIIDFAFQAKVNDKMDISLPVHWAFKYLICNETVLYNWLRRGSPFKLSFCNFLSSSDNSSSCKTSVTHFSKSPR